MKVQEVKKECLASVGLSIEFSNSEIDSIVSLVRDLKLAIDKGFDDLKSHVSHTKQINSVFEHEDQGALGKANLDPDNATVLVDLKSLMRAFSLFDRITNFRAFRSSSLFDNCDEDLRHAIDLINRGEI